MCLYPKLILNPKYKATVKNGGGDNVPIPKDGRVKYVPIGCQNCIECRKQKARQWQVRLMEDIKVHKNGIFITLTLSDKSYLELDKQCTKYQGYYRDNEIITLAVRRFLERWRKEYKVSIRHWLVTELGHNGTENIHAHGIIWPNTVYDENGQNITLQRIAEKWGYGYIYPSKEQYKKNYVNAKTVNYVTKYVTKIDKDHTQYKSIVLTSAGIGRNYTNTAAAHANKYNGNNTDETYRTGTGHKIALPIYWRNKIYNEDEREQLWLQKLDKQQRWIRGEKIDIKDGDKAYYTLLKWHQNENTALGYGTDEKNWSQIQYENERRMLINDKRKQRAYARAEMEGRASAT